MAGNPIDMKVEGDKALYNLCQQLAPRVVDKHLRASASSGGTPVIKVMRQTVPTQSKFLKKALKKKVKLYKAKGTAVAVMGASTDVVGTYKKQIRKPSKYISIVEGGAQAHTYAKRKGSHPGFTGKHFVRNAEKSAASAALAAAENRLISGIEKEASELSR